MVLVPPYIDVDGLIIRLFLQPFDDRYLPGVSVKRDLDRPEIMPLEALINTLLCARGLEAAIQQVANNEALMNGGAMHARPARRDDDGDDIDNYATNWQRLTGTSTTEHDAYEIVEIYPTTQGLLVPRATLRKVLETFRDLNAAVRDGRMTLAMDESMAVPPPRPPLPPSWTDDDLRREEDTAEFIEELDPLVAWTPTGDSAERATRVRGSFLGIVELLWQRTHEGVEDMRARVTALELPLLAAYLAATEELAAYLRDPVRIAIAGPAPDSPFDAWVSVDVFRLPRPEVPAEYGWHEWLAAVEQTFVAGNQPPHDALTSRERYTRVRGRMVRMRVRPESPARLVMWRVELA